MTDPIEVLGRILAAESGILAVVIVMMIVFAASMIRAVDRIKALEKQTAQPEIEQRKVAK